MNGRLSGIYLGTEKGGGKHTVASADFIANHGIRGDSHAGLDSQRHVSLFAQETLQTLLNEGFAVSAEQLSANLFTENLPLDTLLPGVQLRIGQALLEIIEARKPCRSITRIDNRLPKRLYGHCGQLARIISGGLVRVGDTIERLANEENSGQVITAIL